MGGMILRLPGNSTFRHMAGGTLALVFAMAIAGCAPIHAQTASTPEMGVSSQPALSPEPTVRAAPELISLTDLRAKYETSASRYIEVDGVEMHYADEGQGQPVVLLHASFLNHRAWDGVAEVLVQNNYRVIRPDFPNLGLSGIDGKSLTGENIDLFERNADVVSKLVEKLDLGKVYVIGTSSGATAAFRYASYFPDKIGRLVLINSAGMPRTRQSDPNRWRPEEQKWAKMRVKPAAYWANLFSRNFIAPNTAPDWLVTLAYDVNRRAPLPEVPGNYVFRTGDPKAILADITAPTLLLWGMSNPTVVHLEADVIEHWMTGAPTTIRKYEGLGHYPYIENEDLVMGDILAFFDGQMDKDLRQTQRVKVAPR